MLNLFNYDYIILIEEKVVNIYGVDYIVSSDGHLYSTKNIGRGKYHKEITQRLNQDGYAVVTVGPNDHRRTERVHRIIASAFIPNENNLPEVDHIDNDKLNNDITNLQWVTGFENKSKIPFEVRSVSHSGELNGRSKLTSAEVLDIRDRYSNGETIQSISKLYDRGWSTIFNIVKNKTWKGIS